MNKDKVLFFDVETTGLPPKKADWRTDYNTFPYVVSIAWKLGGVEKDRVVKPEGYEIPPEATEIHGITQEQAIQFGRPFRNILIEFVEDLRNANLVVGHNIYFDSSIIKANTVRYFGMDYYELILDPILHVSRRFDTMQKTIKFVGAKHENGRGGKWPKLSELHEKLFPGEKFMEHDALQDVIATERCFWKLLDLGVIEMPKGVQADIQFKEEEPVIIIADDLDAPDLVNMENYDKFVKKDLSGGLQGPKVFSYSIKIKKNEE